MLLIDWGDWSLPEVAQMILRGTAIGDLHTYVLRPWTEGDELVHRTIAEIVQDWSRADPRTRREVVVVADGRSGRAFEVSDLLHRNRIPYTFRDRASEPGKQVLAAAAPESDGAVVGDTVNTASRIESQAPAGGVAVGAETLAALPPDTIARPLGSLSLKGKSEPLDTFLVVGLGPALA